MTVAAEARLDLISLNDEMGRELRRLWPMLRGLPMAQLLEALYELLPVIADEYGTGAVALAADWYADQRAAVEVAGVARVVPASLPPLARFEALARWGVDPIIKRSDHVAAEALIEGGMKRTVSNMHRETVMQTAIADPAAMGWRRLGRGETCDFCRLLIGRGAVYTQSTVRFESHDSCRCIAAPSWRSDRKTPIRPR